MILAFTIVEIVAAIIIGSVLIFGGIAAYDAYLTGQRIIQGEWTVAPRTIPAAPGTGDFTYRVSIKNGKGALVSRSASRRVNFTMTPGTSSQGAVTIVSVTDAAGNVLAVNGLTATGTTDAGGVINLVVSCEQYKGGTLTAADAATGASSAADTIGITAQ